MLEAKRHSASGNEGTQSEVLHIDLTLIESTPDETPQLILRDIPTAEVPKVVFSQRASQFENQIAIDTPLIQEELFAAGFDDTSANAFAIIFHHQHEESNLKGDRGLHAKHGCDLLSEDGNLLYYPVAVHINLPRNTYDLNETLWHELGHAYDERVRRIDNDPLYADKKVINQTKKIGAGTAIGGAIIHGATYLDSIDYMHQNIQNGIAVAGIAAVLSGISVTVFHSDLLYAIDKGERNARKFASERSHLQPIRKR